MPNALDSIRAAVKAHDDALNDEAQPGGPRAPTGDDYNAIHALVMDDATDAAPSAPQTTAPGDMLASLIAMTALAEEAIAERESSDDDEDTECLPSFRADLAKAEAIIAAAKRHPTAPDASALMLAALKAVKAWSEDENEETGDLGAVLVDVAAAIAAGEGREG